MEELTRLFSADRQSKEIMPCFHVRACSRPAGEREAFFAWETWKIGMVLSASPANESLNGVIEIDQIAAGIE